MTTYYLSADPALPVKEYFTSATPSIATTLQKLESLKINVAASTSKEVPLDQKEIDTMNNILTMVSKLAANLNEKPNLVAVVNNDNGIKDRLTADLKSVEDQMRDLVIQDPNYATQFDPYIKQIDSFNNSITAIKSIDDIISPTIYTDGSKLANELTSLEKKIGAEFDNSIFIYIYNEKNKIYNYTQLIPNENKLWKHLKLLASLSIKDKVHDLFIYSNGSTLSSYNKVIAGIIGDLKNASMQQVDVTHSDEYGSHTAKEYRCVYKNAVICDTVSSLANLFNRITAYLTQVETDYTTNAHFSLPGNFGTNPLKTQAAINEEKAVQEKHFNRIRYEELNERNIEDSRLIDVQNNHITYLRNSLKELKQRNNEDKENYDAAIKRINEDNKQLIPINQKISKLFLKKSKERTLLEGEKASLEAEIEYLKTASKDLQDDIAKNNKQIAIVPEEYAKIAKKGADINADIVKRKAEMQIYAKNMS